MCRGLDVHFSCKFRDLEVVPLWGNVLFIVGVLGGKSVRASTAGGAPGQKCLAGAWTCLGSAWSSSPEGAPHRWGAASPPSFASFFVWTHLPAAPELVHAADSRCSPLLSRGWHQLGMLHVTHLPWTPAGKMISSGTGSSCSRTEPRRLGTQRPLPAPRGDASPPS